MILLAANWKVVTKALENVVEPSLYQRPFNVPLILR